MRKLWLRFVLWNNNICPKHGPKQFGKETYICFECNSEWRKKRQERYDSYRKELNAFEN